MKNKIANNKVLLFLLPHIVYSSVFIQYYNSQNFPNYYSVLISELLIINLIYFCITFLIQLLFHKICPNKQAISLYLCFFTYFYTSNTSLIVFALMILAFIIIARFIKDYSNLIMDFVIYLFLIYFGFSFISNFGVATYNYANILIKTDHKVVQYEPTIDKTTPSPNIYYLHCDGMINLSDAKKYFDYNEDTLEEFFTSLDFYVNKDARFVGGHTTQKALVALFNPYYYDNKEKYYLENLEQYYLKQNKDYTKYINYKEINEKRFNNELMTSLNKKGYKTFVYAPYTQNTAINADFIYDYDEMKSLNGEENELKYLTFKNIKQSNRYLMFEHFNNIAMYSSLDRFNLKDKFIKGKKVEINQDALQNTPHIANSTSYTSKSIITVLNESFNVDSSKFVFMDYDLNHLPVTYDEEGNVIAKYEVERFVENYKYTSYFLMDIIDYIKENDNNAIIIVQADHGIHLLKDGHLKHALNISQEEIMNLRNSTFSAIYIPEEYKNGDEKYLSNPLNISRYLVNNYIGQNYEYINIDE